MLPLCYAAPFESKILSSFIFQALIKKLPMFQMTWACLVAVDVVYIFSSILLIAGKSWQNVFETATFLSTSPSVDFLDFYCH